MARSSLLREVGNIDHFGRQLIINERLGLPTPLYCYKSWKPYKKTGPILNFCINFINEHGKVTVRQVCYALISAQIYPNELRFYKRVITMLTNARLAGVIPFNKIVDDTREAEKTPSWDNIEAIMTAAVEQYRSDWWENQPYYVEVWLEKRALRRIFLPITNSYDVHLCIGGGYQSWPMIWQGKNRFRNRLENHNNKVIILYFGDLDPSGKDMARDIQTRFSLLGIGAEVVEVALTRRDIEQYKLPRNPMKPLDSRNKWYIKKYGITYAVELDALPPNILKEKIEQSIQAYADIDELNAHIYRDRADKERWRTIIVRNNGADVNE